MDASGIAKEDFHKIGSPLTSSASESGEKLKPFLEIFTALKQIKSKKSKLWSGFGGC